ncbi:hypothetical protein [Cobetia sp. UIB-001]
MSGSCREADEGSGGEKEVEKKTPTLNARTPPEESGGVLVTLA